MLDDERLAAAQQRLGRSAVRGAVRAAQERVRSGALDPARLVEDVLEGLPALATSLHPVLNATGVVLHTNLGRAPLSPAAREAVSAASAYLDLEYDLVEGVRSTRGRGALAALRAALPEAGDVLIVNNGAAALLLAVTALARRREVVWSRGEMVEIGDGFRLPDLVTSTGARLREVGTTNRTVLADYAEAVGPRTGCLLKIHASNFLIQGFTASVSVEELAGLGPPVVVDLGSGLLGPDPLLSGEPDVAATLRAGAALVTASGDKLLGGPQAGLIFGRAELVTRLRRHPMYRAVRVGKLTLAALEATLSGPVTPTWMALRTPVAELRARSERVAAGVGAIAEVVPSRGSVGGGSGPGVELDSWAVSLPESYAAPLRTGEPPVIGRVERGRCLLDLRCVPATEDAAVIRAIRACR